MQVTEAAVLGSGIYPENNLQTCFTAISEKQSVDRKTLPSVMQLQSFQLNH